MYNHNKENKMKYFKRLKIYKSSTGNNTFDPLTKKAHSYNWWLYCTKSPCGEYVIFNNTTYSSTTSKHQRDTWSLLGNNYKMIVLNNTRQSLGNLSEAFRDEIDGLLSINYDLQKAIDKPRSRKATNIKRTIEIKDNIDRVFELLGYMKKWDMDTSKVKLFKHTTVIKDIEQIRKGV